MLRVVDIPWRSSRRRQKPGGFLALTPSPQKTNSWTGASWCSFFPGSGPQGLGLERGSPAPAIPLLQSWITSCLVHLKADERLLLQLLQATGGKSFFAWANKSKLHSAMECLGSEASKVPTKSPKLPPPQSHTLPILGFKDTVIIFGHKAEDHGRGYHHKSIQDTSLEVSIWL